ncbi:MAG: transposase [Hyphomonadaceae bacterium]|nr:transposase [Hyphomonadaceae bacterium]
MGKVRSQLGRSGYDVDLMLRVLLPGQWHSLSDRKLEEAWRIRINSQQSYTCLPPPVRLGSRGNRFNN